jgi:GH25 family lysozyme M1 (1,4-beta-N-acetylmuramidase)
MPYTKIKGIDASHWDGTPDVDLDKAKKSGIQFWFEKASEGLSVEPTFKKRQPSIRKAFTVRGWYHFCHCDNIDAVTQGIFFSKAIGVLQAKEYVAFDVEQGWGSQKNEDGIKYLLTMIDAFKVHSDATDDQIIIYGSLGWLQGQFGKSLSKLTKYHLWAARYADQLGDTSPWSAALIWQKTESENVPGVGVKCDLNYWLDGHWSTN